MTYTDYQLSPVAQNPVFSRGFPRFFANHQLLLTTSLIRIRCAHCWMGPGPNWAGSDMSPLHGRVTLWFWESRKRTLGSLKQSLSHAASKRLAPIDRRSNLRWGRFSCARLGRMVRNRPQGENSACNSRRSRVPFGRFPEIGALSVRANLSPRALGASRDRGR